MTGARSLVPLALALGCTQRTELLTFCPTSIDVFGGANTQLVGCGGRAMAPEPLAGGYFDPGAQEYDNTLAGRLQARLIADPDLVPLFGSTWKVRSCAAPGGQLSAVTHPLTPPQDSCGPDDSPPAMGSLGSICTDQPAPLVLLVADGVDDGCHGGFSDPRHMKMPDEATYAQHVVTRLDDFLGSRAPRKLIVGPATEWRAAERPARMGAGPPTYEPEACAWQRPDWDEHGVAQWQSLHASTAKLLVVPDLHDEFKRSHPCCQSLGLKCETSWFVAGQVGAPAGPDLVNCDGAGAIVDFWYAALKQYLVAGEFHCPEPAP